MNLLDADVVSVKSAPYENYGKWWVDVYYTCWSDQVSEQSLMFDTLEEAFDVKPGYTFLT